MANEEAKFREAAFFFGRMKAELNDRNAFSYHFSAFINAGRSVVQYALEECKLKPGGQAWHDGYVGTTAAEMIRYFRDKRNLNIHEEPVVPNAAYHVEATLALSVGGSADVRVLFKDQDGNLVEKTTPASEAAEKAIAQPSPAPVGGTKESVRYFLGDRPADDLVDLGQKYLNELLAFLNTARNRGFVPPQ